MQERGRKALRAAGLFVLVAAAQALIGNVATASVDAGVNNQDIQDWAVVVIWLLLIVGGFALSFRVLGARSVRNGQAVAPPDNPLPAETSERSGDRELAAFLEAWGRPAAESADLLLSRMSVAVMRLDPPADDLAHPYGWVRLEALGAYDAALNAAYGATAQDPTDAAVAFYYRYQEMRKWIVRALVHHQSGTPDSPEYRAWIENDRDLLRELRRFSAPPERTALLAGVREVGWGEETTSALPSPV